MQQQRQLQQWRLRCGMLHVLQERCSYVGPLTEHHKQQLKDHNGRIPIVYERTVANKTTKKTKTEKKTKKKTEKKTEQKKKTVSKKPRKLVNAYSEGGFDQFCRHPEAANELVKGFLGIDDTTSRVVMCVYLPRHTDDKLNEAETQKVLQRAQGIGVFHLILVTTNKPIGRPGLIGIPEFALWWTKKAPTATAAAAATTTSVEESKTDVQYLDPSQVVNHPGMTVTANEMWRIYGTLKKLFRDRRYVLNDIAPVKEEDFWKCTIPEDTERLMALFADNPSNPEKKKAAAIYRHRMTLPILRELVEDNEDIVSALIIVVGKIVPQAKTLLETEHKRGERTHICIIPADFMVNNILEHNWQPTQIRVLNEQERVLVGRRFKLSKLPPMQVTDRVAQHLGLQVGDVVEIIETTDHIGEIERYRIVVPSFEHKKLGINKVPLVASINTL